MASNQTSSYGLSQWEATDAVQRLEFNSDNAKVDAALKSLSDQVVQKASQSALNTVISAVNQKADAATVSSLSQVVAGKADSATVAALSQTVAQKADQTDVDTLMNKAGLQLIQRIQLVETDGFVSQSLSIDWDQWGIIWLVLRPKFSVTTPYSAYFIPQPYIYWEENIYGDLAVQLHPFFHSDMEINGHSWTGKTISGNSLYRDVMGFYIDSYSGQMVSGSTLTIWGMR